MDAIQRKYLNDLVERSADVQVQLEQGTGTRPVLWLLLKARERAGAAMAQLALADPTDARAIRLLQLQIEMFQCYVDDCREMLVRGKEADRLIDEAERADIYNTITPDEADDIGIEPFPED